MMTRLKTPPKPGLQLLGDMTLTGSDGTPRRLPTRRAALLLAWLAVKPDGRTRRDMLAQLLWPDSADAQARNSLRQALSILRRVTADDGETPLINADTDHVWLNQDAAGIDVIRFEALATSRTIADQVAAARLFRGPFLAGFPVTAELDHWHRDQQHHFQTLAARLVEDLSRHDSTDDDLKDAITSLARHVLMDDPASEPAHRALIRLALRAGKTNAAKRQYQLCRDAVHRALMTEPEAETTALIDDTGSAAALPETTAPPTVIDNPRPAGDDLREGGGRPSLVVLPFDDLCPDGQQDYFAEGVVEEITAALSRVGDFFVIARQSAMAFQGQMVPMDVLGERLGVRYAVEGVVKRSGRMLRLHVHLIDTTQSRQIWSDRYDGTPDDVFAFQDAIAAAVSRAISPTVRQAEIAVARTVPPENRQAYELVLQAMPLMWAQNATDNSRAARLFSRALDLAPENTSEHGRAAAMLAWCHAQDVTYLWSEDPGRSRQLSSRWITTALPLIGNDPTGLAAAGAAASQGTGDLDQAHQLLRRALQLDPNNAWAWARTGWAHFFGGDYDAAEQCFHRARRQSPLDPLRFNLDNGLAGVHFVREEFAEAAARSLKTITARPGLTWAWRQYAAYAALAGDISAAKSAIARYQQDHPDVTIAATRTHHPQRNNAHYMTLFVRGLRLAGMKEGT